MDIVPLLETERALSGARRIIDTLFENAAYKQNLAARGNTRQIMLGYSDSNKENGLLPANWQNQRHLAAITDDFESLYACSTAAAALFLAAVNR